MINIDIDKFIIKKYYKLINDILNHRYTDYWIKGGRGSTKSSFIGFVIPIIMLSNKNINSLLLRKVSRTLKDSVYNQILWAIDSIGLNQYFKATVSPLEITYTPTKQKIFLRGADDPLKIKSIKPKHGYIGVTWFEELDQFKGEEEIRNILQSANRGGDKFWNFYSYNPPKSKDNWVNIAVDEEKEDKIVVHSTYLDVPKEWLGEQFIFDAEHLKKTKPNLYEHEYLGIPIGIGGTVFENIESREITDEEINSLNKFYYGIDFGFAIDPFVWIKVSYNPKENTLLIIDEIYQVKLKNKQAVDLIKEKFDGNNYYITADSAEPKSIADLNDRGLKVVPSKKGPDSVERGIKWLQDLEKIVIDKKRTKNTYRELSNYEYELDKNGNFISAYPDKNNHSIDAIRYAMETIINKQSLRWG